MKKCDKSSICLKHGKILGIKVKKEILLAALTHPNYSKSNEENFEKLEFIGDSVIDLLVADWLFNEIDNEKVGMLSKIRSLLVQTNTLANIAREINLDKYLRVERRYKVTKTDLEDSLEAIFGAVYVSSGLKKAKKLFNKIFEEKKKELIELLKTKEGRNVIEKSVICEKNPINELQEICQKERIPLPKYTLIKKEGPDHDPTYYFECKVVLKGQTYISNGVGKNSKEAKRRAAEKILKEIRNGNGGVE